MSRGQGKSRVNGGVNDLNSGIGCDTVCWDVESARTVLVQLRARMAKRPFIFIFRFKSADVVAITLATTHLHPSYVQGAAEPLLILSLFPKASHDLISDPVSFRIIHTPT